MTSLKEMARGSGMTQAGLAAEIARRGGYPVTQSEVSLALNGKLDTPKGDRIRLDAVNILRRKRRQSA